MTGRTDGLWQGQPDRWLHCPPAPGTRLGPSRAVGGSRESSGQIRVALNRTASTNIYESPVLLKEEDKKKKKKHQLLTGQRNGPCLSLHFPIHKEKSQSPSVAKGGWVRPTSEGSLLGVPAAKFSRRGETGHTRLTGRAGEAPPAGFVHESDSALFKAKVRSGVCGCTRRLIKTRCQVPPCPVMGPLPLGK